MDVEEALGRLGKFGKYQVVYYLILSVADTFPAAWHMLAIVFIGGFPDHNCKLPPGHTNTSIPVLVDKHGVESIDKCSIYTNISLNNETMSCPSGYDYYGPIGKTIVSQWDLVCDNDYMKDMTQTVMVIGVMVGAMVFTMLADNFGRKPVFLFSQWAMVVIGVITALVDNYYVFIVLRFIAGGLQQGIILTGFIMACELFPAKYRTFAGTAIENFWAIGMCLLALFAYFIRDWRYLQVLITLPGLLTIPFYWILPESVPWLVANNRHKEADDIIRRAAKFNGIEMPDKILEIPESEFLVDGVANGDKGTPTGFIGKLKSKFHRKTAAKSDEHQEVAAKYTILDVFRNKRLFIYAIIMCLLWFVNSLVYYGLSLSTSALAGGPYLNFFLSGLVEIPAYTTSIFVLQKWGRRWPLAVFHIIAGCALAITMFIPDKVNGSSMMPLTTTFNMIGKFGITGSFATVFLYAPEIFPTTLRSQAMGIASVGGRLGNMLAPFSNLVAMKVPWLPGILFGTLSIGVGLLALLLPETLNRPLPQTIEDINNWNKTPADNPTKHEMGELGNDVKA